ncbi:MAG: 1-phosphofructokinase [Wujia sp.]
MIYTVTFNPSLDYVLDVQQFERNQVNRAMQERILPGGKGINVSIVLQNLGVDNHAICFTSGFTGEALKNLMLKRKMNADFIDIENGLTRINVKMRCDGETEINGQGPKIRSEHIAQLYEKLGYLGEEDYLVLAGSLPDSMSKSTYMEIMQLLQYNKIKIIVDTTGESLTNVLPYHPFLIKPNRTELGNLFDVSISNKEEAIVYGKKLQEQGARNVLISMSYMGAVLLTEDGQILCEDAPQGEVRNSVGAGDSMLAGFLAGYIENEDYQKAFRMGICAGSASTFSEELATKVEVDALMKQQYGK